MYIKEPRDQEEKLQKVQMKQNKYKTFRNDSNRRQGNLNEIRTADNQGMWPDTQSNSLGPTT